MKARGPFKRGTSGKISEFPTSEQALFLMEERSGERKITNP